VSANSPSWSRLWLVKLFAQLRMLNFLNNFEGANPFMDKNHTLV
jgi:hypothetical protein